MKLLNRFSSFKCEEAENIEKVLMGWIRRVMINTSIDELRRMRLLPEIGRIPDHIWEIPTTGRQTS